MSREPEGTGIFYGAERQRPELLQPTRPGEHVWIAISTHVLTVETMRAADRGERVHLDAETLAGLYCGCYVCEQPWSTRLSYRRCPGEPRTHRTGETPT